MKTKPKRSMAAPQRKPLLRKPRGKLRQPATLRQAIPEELVAIPEAARMMARNIATVHRWIGRGLIRAVEVCFRTYVRRSDIDWWLSPRPYTGRPPVPPWLETPEPESGGKGQPSTGGAYVPR
jgi:hypothetical protein